MKKKGKKGAAPGKRKLHKRGKKTNRPRVKSVTTASYNTYPLRSGVRIMLKHHDKTFELYIRERQRTMPERKKT